MGLSHFEREEETLVNYFKQMLNESYDLDGDITAHEPQENETALESVPESVVDDGSVASPEVIAADDVKESPQEESSSGDQEDSCSDVESEAAALTSDAEETQSESEDVSADYAGSQDEPEDETGVQDEQAREITLDSLDDAVSEKHDYTLDTDPDTDVVEPQEDSYRNDNEAMEPQLQMQQEVESRNEGLPYAEHQSIASLLEAVPSEQTKVEVEPVETAVETEPEEVTEVVAEVVETKTEAVSQAVVEVKTQAPVVVEAKSTAPGDEHLEWENINMPDEFQALFFLARGVRFAVPLVDLGGIFEVNHLTPLFGRPAWYKGVADIRGKKLNVVDTLRWVKPEVTEDSDFNYIIVLGESLWAISCDKLEGNRYLNKENVKWRQHAGNRPWLAGIVKKEMCALLHVNALISMFNKGFDLTTLK